MMTGIAEVRERAHGEQFQAVARILVSKFADLWGSGECDPPFEFTITDVKGHFVTGLGMDADGKFRVLAETPSRVHGDMPLDVVLVDKLGKVWRTSIRPEDLSPYC